ncbi:hypothetical protein NUW58_g4066 [Xylaria curta]|uniref:Uncharacterized protein n=1 Tax=Xylaria curta TaxID=42375 RepID=A0ACC1P990_9PEZI|nr:hypothetical protein NUW58_g4066 [Xylaria curta]
MSSSGPAELVNYVATVLTLLILLARAILWLWRRERIDTSFILVVISVFLVVARVVVNIYYLKYGSASDVARHAGYFDENNLEDIKTGSILVLVARALITTILWLQVCILLLFYSRITYGVNWVGWVVRATWLTVAATYIGNIVLIFTECQPISLYWQVEPHPGYCVHAYAQLLNQTISNIILDIMLIAIAWPIVGLRKRTIAEHITLWTLFALGTFCIIISIIRVVYVHDSGSAQLIRSLWASVQMLVSTFVANSPNIYGSIRALRKKRSTANSTPAANYVINNRSHRVRTGPDDAWMKMDDHDHDYIALAPTPKSPSYIQPLPPATTLYDDQTAPAPYSHQSSFDGGLRAHDELAGPNVAGASSRVPSP